MLNADKLKPIDEKELSKYEISPLSGRACNYINHDMLARSYTENMARWPIIVGGLANFKNNMVKWYFLVPKNADFEKYLEIYTKEDSRLEDLKEFITKKTESAVKEFIKKQDNLSIEELKAEILLFSNTVKELGYVSLTLREIDLAVLTKLNKILKDNPKKEEILRAASVIDEPSFAIKEELELLKLAKEAKAGKIDLESKKFQERVKKIHDAYCWTVCGYYNEQAKSVQTYTDNLKKLLDADIQKVESELTERFKADLANKEKVTSELDDLSRKLVSVSSESTFLKDYYKFSVNKAIYYGEKAFGEVAKRTGTQINSLKNMNPEEIAELLQGKKIDEKKLDFRNRHNIILVSEGHYSLLEGKQAQEFENKHLAIQDNNQREFRGRIASNGKAKGKARTILGAGDFDKMRKGDILAVINTSPDYVSIIRKAAAIVAEEGGLTAHVSVVAREFGIPCIVGVKNITTILKDGDLVEVDADKGIVRILKRAGE